MIAEPRDHFGGGSWPTGKGLDGGFRHYPIAFEPLCNLQGFCESPTRPATADAPPLCLIPVSSELLRVLQGTEPA